jgi:hypothetical protein
VLQVLSRHGEERTLTRRRLGAAVLIAILVAGGAAPSWADPPGSDPDCTFVKGITTCEVAVTFSEDMEETCGYQDASGNTVPGTILIRYRTDQLFTTIYRGRQTKHPLSAEAISGQSLEILRPCGPTIP